MANRDSLFKLAFEKLGDTTPCTSLFDGLREGVRLAGALPSTLPASANEPTLGSQIVDLLLKAHSQGIDLSCEVMDAMASRVGTGDK